MCNLSLIFEGVNFTLEDLMDTNSWHKSYFLQNQMHKGLFGVSPWKEIYGRNAKKSAAFFKNFC